MKNEIRTTEVLTDSEKATLEFIATVEYIAESGLGFWEGQKIYNAAEEKIRKYFSFSEVMEIVRNQHGIRKQLSSRAIELNLV